MTPFDYRRAADQTEALSLAEGGRCRFLGGGTNLVDLMRQNIEAPAALVDVSRLPATIDVISEGGLIIGAAVRNSALAAHPVVRAHYPMLSRALLAGASAQIRNMATVGGNLLQRTRCSYFYDAAGSRCNKRDPGAGCDAIDGLSRNHAILGTSEHCIATFPSDMCVALAALEARVLATGKSGARSIAFVDFHRLPGDTPQIDSTLRPDEIITAIELPPKGFAGHYSYLKIRDRLSYAFALVSVAAALDVEGGTIKEARLALGGVAHKPWRDRDAEAQLRGAPATAESFSRAAETVLRDARGFGHNDFKIELARRAILRALTQAARGTPQSQADKRIK
jgi:xanthine dehydrogenase YagS FAD-binding subunit